MCEFISWIEKEEKVLFLTADDINSRYGESALENSLDNDFLGHGAIRKFYAAPDGTELGGGAARENRNFWDGNLPQQIKDAWNQGELDGMLRYLQSDDVEYIIANAPADFATWVAVQKYGKDYKAMQKDPYWVIRLAGLAATQDYEAMKTDVEWEIRLVGMAATQDYEAMKTDVDPVTRLLGMAATQDYEAMKTDVDPVTRRFGMAATQDYEAMKKDDGWYIRLVGMAATQDYKAMKKDSRWAIRLVGMAATQDYEAMKKDDGWYIRLAGLMATSDLEHLVRPRL